VGIGFDHLVIGVIDEVTVRTIAALEGVGAGLTVQNVAGAIADNDVFQFIADAVDGRHSGQRQVLGVGTQRPADRGQYGVNLRGRRIGFVDAVASVVDHINIVAV